MVRKRWEYIPRRIPGYDYSQPGFYFVTVCTLHRRPAFRRAPARAVVTRAMSELPSRFPCVSVDTFVCMPDHVHVLLQFDPPVPAAPSNCGHETLSTGNAAQWNCAAPEIGERGSPIGRSFRVDPSRPTLGQVVRAFKALVARRLHQAGAVAFAWQPNYFEWVVRSERSLERIRDYIASNPFR